MRLIVHFYVFFILIFPILQARAQVSEQAQAQTVAQAQETVDVFEPDPRWLEKELKKLGFRKSFIKEALDNYQTETFQTVLNLNLLGFLQPPQHMDRVTPQSVRESVEFVKANEKFFKHAEKKYKVPPSIISALLWIETRHGDDRGRFHIVSVFLHLLQSERKQNLKFMTNLALEMNQKRNQFTEADVERIMKERAQKRVTWAKEQLQALSKIHRAKLLNLKELKGSFAGAFGMAQFIPSSYRDFARSAKPKTPADLMKPQDAIMSVAHYLKKHGWKNRSSAAKIEALMKYNNSRDYADSILEISKRATTTIQAPPQRDVSGGKPNKL